MATKADKTEVEALLDRVDAVPQTYDIEWLMNLFSTSTDGTVTLTAEQFNEIKAAADAHKIFVSYGQVFSSSTSYHGDDIYIELTQLSGNFVSTLIISSLNGTYNVSVTSDQIIMRDDLSGFAKASDIPTKTSQLTNDSGYLTEHQSLDNYYTKKQTDSSINAVRDAMAALQSLIDILNSDSNVDGSVKKTVADAIARVVAGAPEDLDTLKEIADYIASDKTGAAQMAAAISALKTLTAGHTKSIEDLGIAKQDALVSGTNIKTINGVPVLGSGDIKTPAPTKVSELENDKGFLTEHQSLEAYYQKAAAQLDNRVVAEAIVSLAARLDALEGSRGLLGDATAGTVDVRGLTRCRYPLVMLAHGVPAGANVPDNLPDGLPWDGVPVFIGQFYINLDATSGGLYYATGHNSVADWKQA